MKGWASLPEESFVPWAAKNTVCDYIDISYVDLKSRHRIINASNVLGGIAVMVMIAVQGAVESEMYITVMVLIAVAAVCAYLSMKEDGQIR